MQPLTDEFLEQCPVDNGFPMRSAEMTCIEVIVNAACAFAVSMLLAVVLQGKWIPFAGIGYILFGIWIPWAFHYHARRQPAPAFRR